MLFCMLLRSVSVVIYEGEMYSGFIVDFVFEVLWQFFFNFVFIVLFCMKDVFFKGCVLLMIYVGQLFESKGVLKVLEVFWEIRCYEFEVYFYFVGVDIGGRNRFFGLNSKVDQGVILIGFLFFDKIVFLFDVSDFFVFMIQFLGEGYLNVLMEVMVRGCVLVCIQYGFNFEVIGYLGIIVEVDIVVDVVVVRVLVCWRSDEWQSMFYEVVY